MGQNSGVDWCDHSWGPWRGCQPVRLGCVHCFGSRDMKRYGKDPHTVVRAARATFNAPLKWPTGKVFVCPWSDFWHESADIWRDDAYAIMRQRPDHTWIIPTKRENRINECLPPDWGDGWPNVWLLTSVSTQEEADQAIPILIRVPGARCKLGISAEPLIGSLDLGAWLSPPEETGVSYGGWHEIVAGPPLLDWIVTGCESGPGRRPAQLDWFRSLRDQCQETATAYFLKQAEIDGKLVKMPYLDGRQWAEYPT